MATTPIKAVPIYIRFTERNGYELVTRVTQGAKSLVGRNIIVQLTMAQVVAIEDWDADVNYRCELDKE